MANYPTQGTWRWRNDDGGEANATFKAEEKTAITIENTDPIRIRFEVYDSDEQVMNGPIVLTVKLTYKKGAEGEWKEISSSSTELDFIMIDSPNITNGTNCTSDLLSNHMGDVSSEGKIFDDTPNSITFNENVNVEIEYCIKPTDNITGGETYYFKLVSITTNENPVENIASLFADVSLPVELATFSGKIIEKNIVLFWETATEKNNYGFEVERNTASNNEENSWEKIGFVAGNGNSNSVKSYSFTDSSPREGKGTYRLKQIDLDGKYKYSKEIEVEYSGAKGFALEQNYPNPFNPTTKISYNMAKRGNVTIKIFNSIGEEVRELVNMTKEVGNYSVEFNAGDLPSGTYFCVMNTAGYRKTNKLILIK